MCVDVTRLIGLMQQPAFKDKEIVLIGFSGASGDYSEGRALSRDRASAVRERLMAESKIKDVVSIGVGPAAAIACNLDPNTAPLNQRVEVWLRKRT
jgi:outer membrane protein OmpA-like peptidoglycan-associated protein